MNKLGIRRADIVVVCALLALSAAIGIFFAATGSEPMYVSIKVNGTEVCRLPLDSDRVYRISEGNTIEISGGSVRMIYADCPDKICVRTGAISHSGESIVCLPHKTVVTIVGGPGDNQYDVRTN